MKPDEAKERREAPLSKQTTQPELYLDTGKSEGWEWGCTSSKQGFLHTVNKKKNPVGLHDAILPHGDSCLVIWAGDIAQVTEYLACTKPWV